MSRTELKIRRNAQATVVRQLLDRPLTPLEEALINDAVDAGVLRHLAVAAICPS